MEDCISNNKAEVLYAHNAVHRERDMRRKLATNGVLQETGETFLSTLSR